MSLRQVLGPGRWQFIKISLVTFVALCATQFLFRNSGFTSPSPSLSISGNPIQSVSEGEQSLSRRSFNSWNKVSANNNINTEAEETDADDVDESKSCGTLPPLGTTTVRHPKYEKNMFSTHFERRLMVSYDSDREFASPLDGMSFDSNSHIHIFLTDKPYPAGKVTVMFKLDDAPPKLSTTGAPFDFMGLDPTTPVAIGRFHNARFLATARLAKGCHELVVTYIDQNRTSTKITAKFRVVSRPPQVWLVSTVGVRDLVLVSQFIKHYLKVGVRPERFLITVQAEDAADPALSQIINVLKQNYITVIYTWIGPFTTFEKFEAQESMGRRFVLQQDWVMHPDVDEHQRYPGGLIDSLIKQMDYRGYTVVMGEMTDRVSFDGSLPEINPDESLETQFPLVCDITKAVVGGAVTKVVLHRGFLMAEEGGYHTLFNWKHTYGRHFKKVRLLPVYLQVDHFKWTSEVTPKLKHREKVFKDAGVRWWVQSARLRKFVENGNNMLNVSDKTLNCRTLTESSDTSGLRLETFSPEKLDKTGMFTVVLMSYAKARYNNQITSLTFFANLPTVYEVIFIWNSASDGISPPPLPSPTLRPIRLIVADHNSLNNRWNHSIYPKTDAVLMMDDDLMLPIPTIGNLFSRWKYDTDQLVGVVGRNYVDPTYVYPKNCCKMYEKFEKDCMKAGATDPAANCLAKVNTEEWHSMDSFCDNARFVLPKGMFFHRKFLRLYTFWKRKPLRKYVDVQGAHCDDVAFNYVVQNATGKPGVVLNDEVIDLPESNSGLYDGSSEASKQLRLDQRTECVKWIKEHFNGLDLKPFTIESADFELRSTNSKKSPIHFVQRGYSKLYKQLGQCIAANGQKPR